ncbi:hypothetical protein BRC63_01660 [Halobacteriales archaeon QH_10_70_21]|nr:MAG: hypothetical protein BRC63_01660 [Halobacteriales archaeon QH_10_70_21]
MIERLARQMRKEERDLLVLETVLEHHPVGINRIASETGVDEHKARYSLRMLENDGLVEAGSTASSSGSAPSSTAGTDADPPPGTPRTAMGGSRRAEDGGYVP